MSSIPVTLVSDFEAELVQRLYRREEAALRVFDKRYGRILYRVIRLLVPTDEEAQDVLQESLLKIWSSFTRYDAGRGRLYTWAVNICRHQAVDHLRSARTRGAGRTTPLEEAPVAAQRPAPAYVPEHLDVRANLRWLLPDQRVVLDLYYFQGYTQAEIAAHLDLPLGTVKTRCRQAVRQLALLYQVAPEVVEPSRKKRLPYYSLAPHCV
ncbi:RNA polymerase sigma factor [Hymenobacter norwichensis]|uniref:RNA polymerase sigma factor n=1 Tax=Hymenobacter norwichensis TaxID=223903 RepID=UPI0003B71AD0|nr:sigma-70 family RNA polymerase sigma factor [Hymenobacter norwichensis]